MSSPYHDTSDVPSRTPSLEAVPQPPHGHSQPVTRPPWASPRGEPRCSPADVDRLLELFGTGKPDPSLERRCNQALEAASGNVWRAADVLSVWQGWTNDTAV
jgi:hypothetical protein